MELRLLKVAEDGEVVDTGITRIISEFEPCAFCNKPTDVLKETPITKREFYIIGIGQAHPGCHRTFFDVNKLDGTYPIDGKYEFFPAS